MTNFEEYYQEVLNKDIDIRDALCAIHNTRTGFNNCVEYDNCNKCRNDSWKWLGEEFKESEVDWSKVPRGTVVKVSNDNYVWGERFFYAYDADLISPYLAYIDKKTAVISWKYCRLAEVDEC